MFLRVRFIGLKTVLRLSSRWAEKQKEATLFDVGEENPANTSLVNYDEDDEIDDEDVDDGTSE